MGVPITLRQNIMILLKLFYSGQCTFEYHYGKGCGHNVKQTSEVGFSTCQAQCMADAALTPPCWAVAHWDGYSGNDCWKFYSSDPDVCSNNMPSYAFVDLAIRICFDGEYQQTTYQIFVRIMRLIQYYK